MQVNVNGVVSFRDPFSVFSGAPFPIVNNRPLLALYWDDHDATEQGEIFYRTSQDQCLINEVGTNISDAFSTDFTPSSLFIATWDGVPRFQIGSSILEVSATCV